MLNPISPSIFFHLYPVLLYSYAVIQFFAARGRHDDVIRFKMAMVNFQSYYASIDIPYTQFGLFFATKKASNAFLILFHSQIIR